MLPTFIYFILVDRFSNGDIANDGIIDTADAQSFHGGDLQGVERHLDYLENIGVDGIWLSPVFSMRTEKFHGHGAFHGYWIQNLENIEPRFGGEEALLSLSSSMQTRNIYLLLDMVYNHVSFDSPMVQEHPDWFHHNPSITDWNDKTELTEYQVHGLPDIDQNNPTAYNYIHDWSTYWLNKTNAFGFRIDAIRHMESSFMQRLHEDMQQTRPTWFLGEDFQGNPNAMIERATDTQIEALFDFPLYYAMTDSFCDGKSLEYVASILSMDRYYPHNFSLVRFLDNHDVPRITSRCHNNKNMVLLAEFFLFSIPGIPMITYGTESWLTGMIEPENRGDMVWDTDPLQIELLTKMSALRRKYPVLQQGYTEIIEISKDVLVWQNSDDSTTSLHILNLRDTPYNAKKLLHTHCPKAIEAFSVHTIPNTKIDHHSSQSRYIREISPFSAHSIICTTKAKTPSYTTLYTTITIEKYPDTPNAVTIPTQKIRIVGNIPELGGWKAEKGPALHWTEDHWETSFSIPQNQVISYKFVEEKDGIAVWETGDNRFLWSNTDKRIEIR